MKYSSLDTVLSSIKGMGDTFRQNKLDEEERKRREAEETRQKQFDTLSIAKGRMDLAQTAEQQQKIKDFEAAADAVLNQTRQPSPEARGIVEGQAKKSLAKPDFVAQHSEATRKLGKFGEMATPVLNQTKGLAEKQIAGEQAAAGREETLAAKKEAETQRAEDRNADRELKKQIAEMSKGNKDITLGQKQEQFIQNKLTKLGDEIDPSKNVRNAFGIAKIGFDRAERLQTLAEAFKNGNLVRDAEIEELAIGLNQLFSGSAVGSREQIRALVPHTAVGNAMKLKQWLFNEPTGMNQKAFVDRMNGSIVREKNTMGDQIKRTQLQKIAKYNFVRKADPEGWEEVLLSYGVNPDDYDEWVKGGHQQKPDDNKPVATVPVAGGTSFDDLWKKHGGK
jgi:hypothetical protein